MQIPSLILAASLAAEAQPIPGTFIRLPDTTELSAPTRRNWAAQTQTALTTWLKAQGKSHRRFWITNAVYLPQPEAALLEQLRQAGYTLETERIYSIPPPINPQLAPTPRGIEWGVSMTRAPELWAKGEKGDGAMVAIIDTGFAPDHPAIKERWAGIWFDPAQICRGAPCDNNGHGTHVTGTILGQSGSNSIGMAPGARFISCKGCETSSCSESSLLACAEWVVDPKGDGSLKPVAVNNSWGGPAADPWYREAVKVWRAAGILPVFASGNSGPSCGSANSPGDYPETLGIGAVDVSENVASFSSRGPARLGQLQKPDLAAPGVYVRSSCTPSPNYCIWSGTSMATPHVTGAIALLAGKARGDIEAIEKALKATATSHPSQDCGESQPVPNYAYGWGIIDVAAAWEALKPPIPPPPEPPPPPPTPPNEPPRIEILEPPNLARFTCGQVIRFKGRASDAEDGDLSASITWWNRYPFWRGSEPAAEGFTGAACDVGWHIVHAEVTDSAGARSETEIMIEVAPAPPEGAAAFPGTVAAPVPGGRQLMPIKAWWGECAIDLEAIGGRIAKAVEKWSRFERK